MKLTPRSTAVRTIRVARSSEEVGRYEIRQRPMTDTDSPVFQKRGRAYLRGGFRGVRQPLGRYCGRGGFGESRACETRPHKPAAIDVDLVGCHAKHAASSLPVKMSYRRDAGDCRFASSATARTQGMRRIFPWLSSSAA